MQAVRQYDTAHGRAPAAGPVPLAAGRAPSQRTTIFNGVWGFAPHAATLEEVMRVAGTRWSIASGVEAAGARARVGSHISRLLSHLHRPRFTRMKRQAFMHL
jgi:hypothetical protein